MLIPRKDYENDAQKRLILKMRGIMEIVEKAGWLKGIWKSDNYCIGSVERYTTMFEKVEVLLGYPVELMFGVMSNAAT